MITIVIEPFDTLFFRDSRPFNAGENTFAESVIPSPLVLFGAIGDYCLKAIGSDIGDFFNKKGGVGKLGVYDPSLNNSDIGIKGIFLFKNGQFFLPLPANYYGIPTRYKGSPLIKAPVPVALADGQRWDIQYTNLLPLALPAVPDGHEQLGGFIEIGNLRRYLCDSKVPRSVRPQDDFFTYDLRFGNMLSMDTMTVERLYSSSHLRFIEEDANNNYIKAGIALLIKGLRREDFSDTTLSIGGEQRRAHIVFPSKDISLLDDELSDKIKRSKRFLLYLVTPAIFAEGWRPSPDTQYLSNAKLVGAAVNKPLFISGWMRETAARGRPRPIRKAAPAGSVYFFDASNCSDDELDKICRVYSMNESISDEYRAAGFGITAVGFW